MRRGNSDVGRKKMEGGREGGRGEKRREERKDILGVLLPAQQSSDISFGLSVKELIVSFVVVLVGHHLISPLLLFSPPFSFLPISLQHIPDCHSAATATTSKQSKAQTVFMLISPSSVVVYQRRMKRDEKKEVLLGSCRFLGSR